MRVVIEIEVDVEKRYLDSSDPNGLTSEAYSLIDEGDINRLGPVDRVINIRKAR